MEKPNNQVIINGGEEIDVQFLDGTAGTVKVELLKIAQFEDYLRAVDKEARTAELLCGKPEGWGDTLTPDSLLDVVEKGHDINFTTVYRWAKRRTSVNEAIMPIAQKGAAMAKALPTSAPTGQ